MTYGKPAALEPSKDNLAPSCDAIICCGSSLALLMDCDLKRRRTAGTIVAKNRRRMAYPAHNDSVGLQEVRYALVAASQHCLRRSAPITTEVARQ